MAKNTILHQSLFGDIRPFPKPFKSPRTEMRPKHQVWIGQDKGRRCRECGHTGPLKDFRTNNANPDGVDAICKKCGTHHTKQWQLENRDRKSSYDAAYYEEHREEKASYHANRHRRNRIYWYQNEPEGTKTCPRCNTEKYVGEFYKDANQDDGLRAYCTTCDNARVKERGSGYRKHWRTLLEAQGGRCNPLGNKHGCGCPLTEDDDFHVDHILPVSKGGGDEIDNLQVLCARCNRAWGARIP